LHSGKIILFSLSSGREIVLQIQERIRFQFRPVSRAG